MVFFLSDNMRYIALHAAFAALLTACTAHNSEAVTQTYSTQFIGTEEPLSEGGAWTHLGLDWTNVKKSDGIAFGAQSGTGGYDDSYARLSGFSPNQRSVATIHLIHDIDASCSHEVELLLRWSDSAHSATGYEANLSFDGGYAQIVRWNGALGAFTVLGEGSHHGLKDGDTFKATVNGNVIAIFLNNRKLAQVTDNTYSTGNPGIGFFRRNCGSGSDFGLSNFTATGSTGRIA